ncbi:MAG: bifunctional ADP-heptose synthase [Verrucomicrobiota bacterium]|nr:bifunctional ADP-heptose synthase [Verrucomicrobiota bacterium]
MKPLLEAISRLRILVVGDAILDHYIFGDANRISPEAPVPVVDVERDSWTAGGSANVAINLTALGAKAELIGLIGRDSAGQQTQSILKERGVDFDTRFISDNAPTILKTRVVVRNQQLCRIDREGSPSRYRLELEKHRDAIAAKVRAANAVIVSDYAKGLLTEELVAFIKAEAHAAGIFIACDPKPKRKLDFSGFDLITPNRSESLLMAQLDLHSHDAFPAEAICRGIHQRFSPKLLIVTLGPDGMLISREGRMIKQLPTFAREVYDVSGAGDTAVATLTAALATGASDEEAAHFANTASGVVVGKFGTATATPAEILAYHQGH